MSDGTSKNILPRRNIETIGLCFYKIVPKNRNGFISLKQFKNVFKCGELALNYAVNTIFYFILLNYIGLEPLEHMTLEVIDNIRLQT